MKSLGQLSIADVVSPRAVEDELLTRIAYYKARLVDIEKAPSESKHREGWERVVARLEESQFRLARLRSRGRRIPRGA